MLWLALAVPAHAATPWWDEAWTVRARLRVPNASAVALDGLPLLVRLGPDTVPTSASAAGGDDLRFVDASGAVLPHEIESWDAGGAAVWVRLSAVPAHTEDTVVWLYLGNAGAPDTSDAPATWADALGVWHLGEVGSADATGNSVTTSLGVPAAEAGMVGTGRALTQAGQGYQVADADALDAGSSITVSAWIRLDDWRTDDGVIASRRGGWALARCGDDRVGWTVAVDQGGGGGPWGGGPWGGDGELDLCSDEALSDGAWHHVVGVYDQRDGPLDPSGARLYVDGALVDDAETSDRLANTDDAVVLGNDDAHDVAPNAVLDEVRIYDDAWSTARVAADHASVTGTLATWCSAAAGDDPFAADPCGAADLALGGATTTTGGTTGGTTGPGGDPGEDRAPGADGGAAGTAGCDCSAAGSAGGLGAALLALGLGVSRRRRDVTARR
ncbi:MAG: DUF2341 domain-containing protein [Myxococcota bacterium]